MSQFCEKNPTHKQNENTPAIATAAAKTDRGDICEIVSLFQHSSETVNICFIIYEHATPATRVRFQRQRANCIFFLCRVRTQFSFGLDTGGRETAESHVEHMSPPTFTPHTILIEFVGFVVAHCSNWICVCGSENFSRSCDVYVLQLLYIQNSLCTEYSESQNLGVGKVSQQLFYFDKYCLIH